MQIEQSGSGASETAAEAERLLGYRGVEKGPGWEIALEVQPGQKLDAIEFAARYRDTIAVDGAVTEESFEDESTNNINLDHHSAKDRITRIITPATCEQALALSKARSLDRYRDAKGNLKFSILAEDCDPDVAASYFVFLLKAQRPEVFNPQAAEGKKMGWRLSRMIRILGNFDRNAGRYDEEVTPAVEECCWAVAPYFAARDKDLIQHMDGRQMHDLIQEMCGRFMKVLDGTAERKPLEGSYEKLSEFQAYGDTGPRITFIREIDSQGVKTIAFEQEGLDALVSVFKGRKVSINGEPTQLYVYKFNTAGLNVDFPATFIYEKLNRYAEERNAEWKLRWLKDEPGKPKDTAGGAQTTGGTHKGGIPVAPEELEVLMKGWLAEFNEERRRSAADNGRVDRNDQV